MVMWGGYHYIVSQGNPQRMKLGKETINNSIIGLALALTSFLLLSLVNPELVSFRGIVPEFVSGAFQPLERTTVPEKSGSTVVRGDYPTIAARVRQHPDWIAAIQGEASAQVPAERILAILFVESAGIENARSSANAYGLMQLLPSTAQQFGVSQADLFNGVKNIQGGARYLKSLYENTCPAETSKTKCTNGQPCRSATSGDAKYQFVNAAYNGGRAANHCSRDCPGQTWSQCTGNPGYAETRNYIIKAQDAYQWIVDNRFFSS
ncbi:MAG: lytic transglycosylase domain-containing protein [Candidatus Kerfeldbacteria bacterium]|nr:lytic transglycosylase domain-containing protein [Candidatus Kerfeldbacteria bacterium]